MFEFIRTHKKWIQILLALFILPSFIFVGVNNLPTSSGGGADVASLEGSKITQKQWDEAQANDIARYRAQYGESFDQKVLETPEAKQAILERLIGDRAIQLEVAQGKLTYSDAAVEKEIMQNNGFLRADGSPDLAAYEDMLKRNRMTEKQLYANERQRLASLQLRSAIESTSFVPKAVSSRVADTFEQVREVQELQFPAADFTSQVTVTDDMVKAYYDKNATLFQAPEQMKIEYVVLDPSVVEPLISVTDAEVAAYYEVNKKNLVTPEQRYSSHILIAVNQSASAADKAAAKAKADAILADLRKAPASFAAVAKAKSDDTDTAVKGGDQGLYVKDTFTSPEEAEAVLKLNPGEISDVISSNFGYHIVTVTKLVPKVTTPLEAAKPQILAELKKSKMAKKFPEMAEQFNNTVFEQADSLKPVAEKLGLKIQTADHLGRAPSPALGTAPINNARFLTAIFSDEVLKNKRNTEAVEVAANTLVSGRVVEWKPAAKLPLTEVAAAIRQIVIKEEAVKLARKAGEAKLAAVKASGDAAGFGDVKTVSRTAQPPIQPAAALEVLKADTSKLPAYVGVDLPGMGYGVYRISKVTQPTEVDAAKRAALATEVNSVNGQLDTYAYIQALKAKAKAKVLVKPVVSADAK